MAQGKYDTEDFQHVIIMTTGGTIDKSYDEFSGSLSNRQSQIKHRILSKLRLPYTRIEVVSIMSKDSLQMTDYDRSLLVKSIEAQSEKGKPIVVLHGTDTMAKSATFLHEQIDPKVPVVFTGAMKPLGFEDSDALQNVTEALLAAQMSPPGVYISFHNRVFSAPNFRKNHEKGTFETIKK
jgi:L-asparaginase